MISDRRYIFFCRNPTFSRKYNEIMVRESDHDDVHLYEVRLMLKKHPEYSDTDDTNDSYGADLVFSSLKMLRI